MRVKLLSGERSRVVKPLQPLRKKLLMRVKLLSGERSRVVTVPPLISEFLIYKFDQI